MGNAVVHFEVIAKGQASLGEFYGELFGWTVDATNPAGYRVTSRRDHPGAGGLRHEVPHAPQVVRLVARRVLELDRGHPDVAHHIASPIATARQRSRARVGRRNVASRRLRAAVVRAWRQRHVTAPCLIPRRGDGAEPTNTPHDPNACACVPLTA